MDDNYRLCLVNDKKALFHKWVDGDDVIKISTTLALVEFEDGTIAEVEPLRIKFLDSEKYFI